MTRKELARLTRQLMPYMTSSDAVTAGSIAEGLDMTGSAAEVSRILGMIAPHLSKPEDMPAGLRAIIAATQEGEAAR